jgi:GNAT superfamily N-acetyltransferase
MEIRSIDAAQTWPIRQEVLRPHQPLNEMEYPGDLEPSRSFHLGAFREGLLVGIASAFREPLEDPKSRVQDPTGWRLRGMATLPEVRGQGYGRALVEQAFELVRTAGGTSLWCNARIVASEFYLDLGFSLARPDTYEIAGIGPHRLMIREL